MKYGTIHFSDLNASSYARPIVWEPFRRDYRWMGDDSSAAVVTEWLCRDSRVEAFAQMKTVNQEEPVARSRFIDCPNCKTRSLKLKRVVQAGRCKSCHESYKIVIVYVMEGKKTKPTATTASATNGQSPNATLPSWQIPSDSSLFGSSSTEADSTFSDTSSIVGEDDGNKETSTGTGQ